MKKSYILLFILLFVALVVIVTVPFSSQSSKEQTRDTLAKEQVYKLKMAHNMPPESVMHQAAGMFARQVAQKTNNRVLIEIYPAQMLGNDYQMVEMARLGEIDILLTPSAKMSVSEPSMQFADLPFFFPSREDLYYFLDGEVGDMLLAKLSSIGLLGVTFWDNGFKHFTSNEPLLSVEDFAGKKMRVMKSRIIMDQFKALGAQPVAIDFHKTKKALQDGVVDGQENPLTAIVSMDIHRVQNYLTLSEHAYMGYIFSISSKTYKKLPQDLSKVLIDTALEITPIQRAQTQANEEKLLGLIKASGVEVHTLQPQERAKLEKLMEYIPKKYEELIGGDILSRTQEILFNKYKKDEDLYVIGVDVDLSMDAKSSGLAIKRGVELAVEEINAKGGILGKKIAMVTKDNSAMASKGVKNVEDLLKYKNLIGVVGGLHSAVVLEQMDYMQHSGVSLFIPWAAASSITNRDKHPCTFRISANDFYASDFIASHILKRFKKPAIFYENSVWGRDNYTNMKRYLGDRGVKLSYTKQFNRGTNDFTQDIANSLAEGADALIMIANPLEGAVVVQNMAKLAKPLPIVSHWGITGGDFFTQNHKAIQKLDLNFFQTFSFAKNKNRVSQKLAQNYIQTYDKQDAIHIKAASGVAHAYDLINILALAIKQAGSAEHTAICREMQNIEIYEGAVKKYIHPFTLERHDALDVEDFYMARYGKNGEILEVVDE
ncbi:MAG: DctP family TRAP transporter solute-binding subunit [Helicobacteraceae bacterium]|nr:DctP family TRAP transporter solute-binding subunit [Helicobacteraceae bacterium]